MNAPSLSKSQSTGRYDVLFLCGAKDIHAMDKYSLLVKALGVDRVLLVTDTLEGEGQKNLCKREYNIKKLLIIDKLTIGSPSNTANFVRNLVKFALIPIQAWLLNSLWTRHRPLVVHAAPIYYMLLCYFARIPYVGTPQAAEIFRRSKGSRIYRFFANFALKGATTIIVDSLEMKHCIKELFGHQSIVIKNGFDTGRALRAQEESQEKNGLLSIRSIQDNYQTAEILEAANRLKSRPGIKLAYPAHRAGYFEIVQGLLTDGDELLGRLERRDLYKLMASSLLVVSIPVQDSSPRSVYEAIFCGAIVAVTDMPYLQELPDCMRERIYVADISNKDWLSEAIAFAKSRASSGYVPSDRAIMMCDQDVLIRKVVEDIYQLRSAL